MNIKVALIPLRTEYAYSTFFHLVNRERYFRLNNDLNYDITGAVGYNSNSFTRGLLGAVGITVQQHQHPSSYGYYSPGWYNGVPLDKFGV